MSDRAKKAQQKVIEEKLEEMLEYYAGISCGKFPEQIAVDAKTYRGKVLRWVEPLIPGADNVVLIEEVLGDSWTLRFEKMEQKIQVFTS